MLSIKWECKALDKDDKHEKQEVGEDGGKEHYIVNPNLQTTRG